MVGTRCRERHSYRAAPVYFNGLFILATAGLYAVTHWEALLLVIVVQHVEAAHQLLPFLRLDGYYIVADLTGVPDLFSRIKPILAASLPWTKTDPKVKELKPWARLVVTVWVILVVPLLLFQLVMLLIHAPRIFATAAHSLAGQAHAISKAFGNANVLGVAGGVLQTLILLLPLVGIVLTFARLGGRIGKGLWRSTEGKPLGRAAASLGMAVVASGLIYTWLPGGAYQPIRQGEKGTVTEGIIAISQIPSGQPGLVSEQKAADAGRLVLPPGEDPPVSTIPTTTIPPPPTTAAPAPGTATTVPAGSGTTVPAGSGTTVPAGSATTVTPPTTLPSATTTTEAPATTTTTTVRRTTTTTAAP